jgi:GDPmannose 4,6-dehydratase
LRPAEVELLIGDSTKARKQLGWEPSVTFQELVHLMVDADLQAIGQPSPSGKDVIPDIATVRQQMAMMHD